MQQIFEFLGNLPTGHFTIGALLILVALGLLWGLNELARHGIGYLLAFDEEGAPKVEIPNLVESMMKYAPIFKKKWCCICSDGYKLAAGYEYNSMYEATWPFAKTFSSEELAENALNLYVRSVSQTQGINYTCFVYLLGLDLLFLLFQLAPTLTITISTILGVCWGIRFLAKKVWQNTSKIGGHEERITKLEEK